MENLTKDYFDLFDKIPTLLKYFYLSEENTVTINLAETKTPTTVWVDKLGNWHTLDKSLNVEIVSDDIELKTLYNILFNLEKLPPDRQNFGFTSKWDEVVILSSAYFCNAEYKF